MKFFTLIIVFTFLISPVFAQAPHIQWQKTIGGDKDDELYSIEPTIDGGYILGGSSNSTIAGDKTVDPCYSTTKFDFWIVKVDCQGNIEWQKEFGATNTNEIVNSIQQTKDSGYLVGGYTEVGAASCNKTTPYYGIDDWWVLKLDKNGNLQWQQQFGGSCNDFLNSVEQTVDGGYILGGNSRSNVGGNKAINMCGNTSCQVLSDYWLIKLDAQGTVKWQQDYGSTAGAGGYSGDDNLNAVHQTRDKGYILGGTSNGGVSCTKSSNTYGGYDYWIIKTDSAGVVQWQQDIGGSGLEALNDIHQTADGGYIAGGTTASNTSGNKTGNTWANSTDYYVVKLDSLGNIKWQKDIGGNGYDGLNSIEQTSDSGYILGGFSNSGISGDKTINTLKPNQYDYWTVKMDSIGNIQWQLDIGRNDTQAVLFGAHQTPDGGYILGGVTNPSSINLSGKVNNVSNPYGDQFGGNGTHYWIVKLGDCSNGYCGAPLPQQDSICAGDSMVLTGVTEYGGFNWVVVPGGSPINSLSCTTCKNPVASPTQTTRYVELAATNPGLYCGDTATIVVIHPPIGIRIDTSVCLHDSVQVRIPIDSSIGSIPNITWNPPYYLSDERSREPQIGPLSSITYYVTLNFFNRCATVDTVSVTVNNLAKTITSDTTICKNDSVQLHVPIDNGGIVKSIEWSPSSNLSSSSVVDPYCTLSSDMSYVVTINYQNRCKTIDTFNVAVNNITKATVADTSICKNSVSPPLRVSGDQLQWYTSMGDMTGMNTQPVINTTVAGIDTLYVGNQCGKVPVHVQVLDLNYPAAALNDTTVCRGILLQLNTPMYNDVTYKWSTGSASCCITVDSSGTYVVEAKNECGDVIDTAHVVFAPCDACLWAPDGFTPNGDGRNDKFRVINRCNSDSYHVIIVDRFGQIVYESSDASQGWDGTFNGVPMDIGTYFYWVTASPQMTGTGQVALKGNVTLIR